MADRANQHYVPKFYFKYFSEDGKSICSLTREAGKIVPFASIKGQASKKYFYGDSDVEKQLSKIDELYSTALKEIKRTGNLRNCERDNYSLFLQNIMLQKTRTISARKKSKAMQDKMLQLFMECEVNNDSSLSDDTKKDFRCIARRLEANPKQYQIMEMSIAIECIDGLSDLLPVILHNRTGAPFIFGDAPVVFTNPLYKNITIRGVLGTQTPGLVILYPLGLRQCVMLIDPNSYQIKNLRNYSIPILKSADIDAINRLQIHNAASAVYFSNIKWARYVSGLWKQENKKLVDHKGNVVEAPGFNHDGQPMGDIIHSFEQQLPFIPRFSFLGYQEVPEDKYRFSRREEKY